MRKIQNNKLQIVFKIIKFMDNIYQIQKNKFSSLQSKYHILLNNIKQNKKFNEEIFYDLYEINSEMQSVQNKIDNLLYNLNSKNKKNSEKKRNFMKDYKDDKKTINAFLPMMIYYRLLLQQNN